MAIFIGGAPSGLLAQPEEKTVANKKNRKICVTLLRSIVFSIRVGI